MKKLAVLVAFISVFVFSGCKNGKDLQIIKDERTLQIIKDENPLQLTEVPVPEFENDAILRSFDGRYACFTVIRNDSDNISDIPVPETALVIVYDTENYTVEKQWNISDYRGYINDVEYKDGCIYYANADYENKKQSVYFYDGDNTTEIYSVPFDTFSSYYIDLQKDRNSNILFIYNCGKDEEYKMTIGIAEKDKGEIIYNISSDTKYSIYNLYTDGKNKDGLHNTFFNTVNYFNDRFYIDRWNANKTETVALVPSFSRFFSIAGDNAFYYEIIETAKGKKIMLTAESLTNETTVYVDDLGIGTVFQNCNSDKYMVYNHKTNNNEKLKILKSDVMEVTLRDIDYGCGADNVVICIAGDRLLLAEEYYFDETSRLYMADLS